MKTATAIVLPGALAAAAVVVWARGPLDPPTGVIASTPKTLMEVEPRTAITAGTAPGGTSAIHSLSSGSYYLTGNVIGQPGKAGLLLNGGQCTIDLNGFALIGDWNGTSGTTGSAIRHQTPVPQDTARVTIRNGTIANWAASGIDLGAIANCRIENVRVVNCRFLGINVGESSIVTNCEAIGNGNGISCTGIVRDCRADGNQGWGIASSYGVFDRCIANDNQFDGIHVGAYTVITECTTLRNSRAGIRNGIEILPGAGGGLIYRNECHNNLQDGILIRASTYVLENACEGNGFSGAPPQFGGVRVLNESILSWGNRVSRNTLRLNATGMVCVAPARNNLFDRNAIEGSGANTISINGAGNVYGEVLDFTGGGTITNTSAHPWATFKQ